MLDFDLQSRCSRKEADKIEHVPGAGKIKKNERKQNKPKLETFEDNGQNKFEHLTEKNRERRSLYLRDSEYSDSILSRRVRFLRKKAKYAGAVEYTDCISAEG